MMTADDAYSRVTRRLLETTGYQPRGASHDWRCPAHDDRNASLSVDRGNTGLVIFCHAGCPVNAVLDALHLTVTDLYDQPVTNGHTHDERPVVDRTYPYTDEYGTLLFEVVRLRPKGFRQRRPDGNGGWDWKLGDTRRPLYRLPKVLAAARAHQRVWVVEGEKDVEALEAAGQTATCNPGGAGKWRPEHTEALRGARVTIVADQDDTGQRHAQDVAVQLAGVARTVRIVNPAVGKDAADHLGAGLGIDDFAGEPEPRPALEWVTAAEHAANVDALGPVGWLIRPIWPGDSHGIIAAEQKAGKTWAALDLAVSVASGTPWLGVHPCDTPGPVIVCLGEGGQRKMLRRLRAICDDRGVTYEQLPIHLTFRVPHLTDKAHLSELADKVAEVEPRLVIIDPLYLAARGAKASQLIEMGEHLEAVQQITQQYGSALAIVHHWNKTGTGGGAARMTGVGGQEWGRVLLSAAVVTKHTDPDTRESRVVLEYDLMGDEVPEMTFRVRRTVRADEPDELDSPLRYHVEEMHPDTDDSNVGPRISPAARRVHNVLLVATDWLTVRAIGDQLANDGTTGTGLKKRTIQVACRALAEADLAIPYGQDHAGEATSWRALDARDALGRPVRDTWNSPHAEELDDLEPEF